MDITILPLEDHKRYSVNGHAVYKADSGYWASATDMTDKEWSAFRRYQKLVINNKAFTKHTKSIFKSK